MALASSSLQRSRTASPVAATRASPQMLGPKYTTTPTSLETESLLEGPAVCDVIVTSLGVSPLADDDVTLFSEEDVTVVSMEGV